MIRTIQETDRTAVTEIMRVFYASEAVLSSGSAEIFENDISECLKNGPYLKGYVFGEDGILQGYAMTAFTFNTEYGRRTVWIEDLYVKEEYRERGLGTAFLKMIREEYPDCLLRLEAEEENEGAMRLYRKQGFHRLPYVEMKQQNMYFNQNI
ncbi:MAG TPA: N-acetyltransferase [Erysipelotrichaceae bacterium]|nr:N-acetyltransferase [Erysipelotrichaceae bacterium]